MNRHLTSLFCLASSLSLQAAPPPGIGSQLPEVSTSVLRIFGALLFILALLFGAVWLIKNFQRFHRPGRLPPQLHLVEIKPLAYRQHLLIVAYQDKRLLLASSPAGINFLFQLPDQSETLPAPAVSPPASFTRALQQLIGK